MGSMEGFYLIQHFFTRMTCKGCHEHLTTEGVELIRHDDDMYIVNVSCTHCKRQMGMAMVGVNASDLHTPSRRQYDDPELTPAELDRLSVFETITDDDVLEAHQFFGGLGADWQKHLPPLTEPICLDDLEEDDVDPLDGKHYAA